MSNNPFLGLPRDPEERIRDLVSVKPRLPSKAFTAQLTDDRRETFHYLDVTAHTAPEIEEARENTLTIDKIRKVMESLPPVPPLVGTSVIKSIHCVTRDEDWSRVRSPGRARRRRAKHRQNIVVTELPAVMCIQGQLYAHPELYDKLRDRLKEHAAASIEEEMRMYTRGIFGGW